MKKILLLFLIGIILVSGCISNDSNFKIADSSNKKNIDTSIHPEKFKENTSNIISPTKKEDVKTKEFVPVTFRIESSDPVTIQFPVFWSDYRFPAIRMERKDGFFEATANLPKNGLIRYGYLVEGKSWEEREQFKKGEEPNRMIHVTGPMTISDNLYSTEDNRSIKIFGKINDKNGNPVVDAVINLDSIITFPAGDGSYKLNIRPGKKQMIVYLLDGSYKTESRTINFQSDQKLNFELEKSKPVKVKLKVNANPPKYHKVRLYSSAEQTGARFLYLNRFLTENFKVLENNEIELNLYEDQYIDYLYTVGNPYIGYENIDGQHIIRNFIAEDNLIIEDNLSSFTQGNEVELNVKVPEYTDPKDVIGLKGLHPTPIFMHPKGNNEWILKVSGYIDSNSKYRYYKGFQGDGDDKFGERKLNGDKNDTVEEWKLQNDYIEPYQYTPPKIKNKYDIFIYPYDYYSSDHSRLMKNVIDRIAEKGFHGISLSQIWGYDNLDIPKISRYKPMTLYMSLYEIKKVSNYAHSKGLKVIMFPQLVGGESVLDIGKEFDDNWWDLWLDEIEKFNLYNARTSQAAGIEYLIFESRQPGLYMKKSYHPKYNKRMKKILQKMKKIFKGKIITIADWEEEINYWHEADIVSKKIWDSLDLSDTATQNEIDIAVAKLLDEKYKKIHLKSGKPFMINQLAYGSINEAVNGKVVPETDGSNTDAYLNYVLDLKEQKMIHEAFYKAINDRDWIVGVNLFGYGFTDTPLSRDVNPRSKPAEDVASSWAKKISKS